MKLLEKLASRENPITIHLVRHGECDGNVLGSHCPAGHDMSLTQEGKTQVERLAEYFKSQDIKITDVYVSPLVRAQETGDIIAHAFGVELVTEPDLRERNWGVLSPMVWQEIAAKLDGMSQEERYNFTPEDGESWREMEERVLECLERIIDENDPGEHVVVVTHNGVLRAILPLLDQVSLDNHKDYSVSTGSVSTFVFDTQGIDLLGLIPEEKE